MQVPLNDTAPHSRPLVVTDGSAESMGALRTAIALTRQRPRPVVLLATFAPVPSYAVGARELEESLRDQRMRLPDESLLEAVGAQLGELGAETAGWEVFLERDPSAAAITRAAAELRADLVLVGLTQPRLRDRIGGGPLALRVLEHARVPVLAIPADAADLPGRALVAVDFADLSREAAFRALDLLRAEAELHLAHALTRKAAEPVEEEGHSHRAFLADLEQRLDGLRRELQARRPVDVHSYVLKGNPAKALLRLADELRADLIAGGSHGRDRLERLVMGSVSAGLLQGAKCAVLVVPPAVRAGAVSGLELEEPAAF